MPKSIRFALCFDAGEAARAFQELADAIRDRIGLPLEPLYVSTYAGLAQAIEDGGCDVAWLPPVVAQGLYDTGIGRPIATAGRAGRTSYYSVLLKTSGTMVGELEALTNGRAGWVSKLSAAGYVVPSLYLRSLGLDPDAVFQSQTFFGNHHRVLEALRDGEIDIAATYAQIDRRGRTFVLPNEAPRSSRVVLAAGPIPGDVIFASAHVDERLRDALRGAFLSLESPADGPLARLMGVDRFEVPTFDHFARLRRWQVRAMESESRLAAAR